MPATHSVRMGIAMAVAVRSSMANNPYLVYDIGMRALVLLYIRRLTQ